METLTASKPASELTAAELKALLANKEADEAAQRQEKRRQYEVLREDTVLKLISQANAQKEVLKAFKTETFNELEALYKLLQEHSSRHADGKGSFSVESADNTMKIMFKRQETTTFDERATQAEKHIIDFLTEEFGDGDPRSKAIRILLEPKNGKADKDNVLKLISMRDEFANDNWRKGIQLYQESIVPANTKFYAQFFVRSNADEAWQGIVLDFARL